MLELSIIGYLGNDCVVRNVNGKDAVNFSIAHTESYTDKDGVKRENTIWVECTAWEKEKIAPYLKKGTQVFARGLPQLETYVNKENKTVASLKLRVSSFQLLGKKADELKQAAPTENVKHDNPLQTEKEDANKFLDELKAQKTEKEEVY